MPLVHGPGGGVATVRASCCPESIGWGCCQPQPLPQPDRRSNAPEGGRAILGVTASLSTTGCGPETTRRRFRVKGERYILGSSAPAYSNSLSFATRLSYNMCAWIFHNLPPRPFVLSSVVDASVTFSMLQTVFLASVLAIPRAQSLAAAGGVKAYVCGSKPSATRVRRKVRRTFFGQKYSLPGEVHVVGGHQPGMPRFRRTLRSNR